VQVELPAVEIDIVAVVAFLARIDGAVAAGCAGDGTLTTRRSALHTFARETAASSMRQSIGIAVCCRERPHVLARVLAEAGSTARAGST